jgi:hypothetical protein
MALTITAQADTVGKAGNKPAFSRGPKPLIMAVYDADMDTTNYASGGEPIASIVADFTEILWLGIEQKDTNTAADKRTFAYDYSAQKILFYDAFATEETASNQTVVALRLLVVGY